MTSPSSNALEGLRDIHMPDPISVWPLAPGWWLAALAMVAAALIVHFVLRIPWPPGGGDIPPSVSSRAEPSKPTRMTFRWR